MVLQATMAYTLAPEMWAYEPPLSLWSLVELYVPTYERDEIKNMLGESLVEQSQELHEEINTLLEIWRDYKDECEVQQPRPLPEPPAVRDRLKQEIKFFVESIREKAKENGRDPSTLMRTHSTDVIEYAMDEQRPGSEATSRPSTACSMRDGRATPLIRTTPSSDRLSLASTLSEEVESMNEKLNVLHLDEVQQHLRETLEDEVSQLLKDISLLHSSLEEVADFHSQASLSREPTLTELREERSKLEKELLTKDTMPKALVPLSNSANKSAVRHVHGTPATPSPQFSKPGRPGSHNKPVKATHDISTKVLSFPSGQDNNHDNGVSKPATRRQQSYNRSNKLMAHGQKQTANSSAAETSNATSQRSENKSAQLVKVATLTARPSSGAMGTSQAAGHIPTPPSSAKPSGRPGSANRFRKMVLECRDGT